MIDVETRSLSRYEYTKIQPKGLTYIYMYTWSKSLILCFVAEFRYSPKNIAHTKPSKLPDIAGTWSLVKYQTHHQTMDGWHGRYKMLSSIIRDMIHQTGKPKDFIHVSDININHKSYTLWVFWGSWWICEPQLLPGKLTCPLKVTISVGNTSSNHWFSGDMLVFRGLFSSSLSVAWGVFRDDSKICCSCRSQELPNDPQSFFEVTGDVGIWEKQIGRIDGELFIWFIGNPARNIGCYWLPIGSMYSIFTIIYLHLPFENDLSCR